MKFKQYWRFMQCILTHFKTFELKINFAQRCKTFTRQCEEFTADEE